MIEFANARISETGALTLGNRQSQITELPERVAAYCTVDDPTSNRFDFIVGTACTRPFVPFGTDWSGSSGWTARYSKKHIAFAYASNVGTLTDDCPNVIQGPSYLLSSTFGQSGSPVRTDDSARAKTSEPDPLQTQGVNIFLAGALLNNAAFSSLLCSDVGDILQTRLEFIKANCDFLLTSYLHIIRRKVLETVKQRLAELLAPDEWEEGMVLPSTRSFLNFIAFLGKFPELRAPGIALADGQFVATWLKTRANIVRLQFDGSGAVKWLVVLASVGRGYPPQRGVGWLPLDRIRKAMEAFDVWRWLSAPVST